MAGLGGFASHGGSFLSGHNGSPWVSQAPTFHLLARQLVKDIFQEKKAGFLELTA